MHAGNFAQAGHNLFQVFEIGDVEDDLDAGLAVGGMGPDVADVALRVADDTCDIFQHAKTIVAVDGKLDWISRGRAFVAGPLDVNAAFRLEHQVGDVGAAYGVNGDSLATRNVADDALSTNGIATAGAVDQHIALTLDHDGVVVAKDAAHNAGDGAGLVGEPFGLDITGHRRRCACGQQARQYLTRGIFSVADARH